MGEGMGLGGEGQTDVPAARKRLQLRLGPELGQALPREGEGGVGVHAAGRHWSRSLLIWQLVQQLSPLLLQLVQESIGFAKPGRSHCSSGRHGGAGLASTAAYCLSRDSAAAQASASLMPAG